MKRREFMAAGLMGMAGLPAAAQGAGVGQKDARARELIQLLKLEVLPKESGYLGIIGRSALEVMFQGQRLAAQSENYYMLTRERPINYLHWLSSDDTHVLIEGGPVDYFVFHADGRAEKVMLGMDLARGDRPATSRAIPLRSKTLLCWPSCARATSSCSAGED